MIIDNQGPLLIQVPKFRYRAEMAEMLMVGRSHYQAPKSAAWRAPKLGNEEAGPSIANCDSIAYSALAM
jgi:hypothetical protein